MHILCNDRFVSTYIVTNLFFRYDLLAKSIPEFARLKELCKIVSCVKLMATRQRELKKEADAIESQKGLFEWITTSSEQSKNSKAFNKALKDIKFGALKDDDFNTDEQEVVQI